MATATKAKTAPAAEEAISIKAPDFRRIDINIRGTSPLVVNRFSAKAIEQMRATQEA